MTDENGHTSVYAYSMATEAEYDDDNGGPAIFLLRAAETNTYVGL